MQCCNLFSRDRDPSLSWIKRSLIKISSSMVLWRRLTALDDKSRSAAFFLPSDIFGTPISCAGDADIMSVLTVYITLLTRRSRVTLVSQGRLTIKAQLMCVRRSDTKSVPKKKTPYLIPKYNTLSVDSRVNFVWMTSYQYNSDYRWLSKYERYTILQVIALQSKLEFIYNFYAFLRVNDHVKSYLY